MKLNALALAVGFFFLPAARVLGAAVYDHSSEVAGGNFEPAGNTDQGHVQGLNFAMMADNNLDGDRLTLQKKKKKRLADISSSLPQSHTGAPPQTQQPFRNKNALQLEVLGRELEGVQGPAGPQWLFELNGKICYCECLPCDEWCFACF
ncbi:hypothetical protein QBC43DRAFT_301639 [Cladorrhinum sp. PSN259]|nr:hypothetical protein QBC43DRAFT_301639 [Cladorrhinum sp. PSN259]